MLYPAYVHLDFGPLAEHRAAARVIAASRPINA